MTERELLRHFLKQLKKHAAAYVYREADTYGGQKKPFDFYMLASGVFYAIEAKKGAAKLEPHQKKALQAVADAGGMSFVLRFICTGPHWRVARFEVFGREEACFTIEYRAGSYINLENLPTLLWALYRAPALQEGADDGQTI